jgi:hypothetical protein
METLDNKNSFLLYTDYMEQIAMLNLEQRGILLTALMQYQMQEDLPEMDDMTKMAFSFISANVRRNNEKYSNIVEKRRKAGRKGAQRRWQNMANVANAGDNDNDNVNDNDNDNVNDSVYVNEDATPSNTHTDHPHRPDIESVEAQAMVYGTQISDDEAKAFIEYNEAAGWKLEWKYALKRWLDQKKERGHPKVAARGFNNFEGRDDDSLDPYALGLFANN